MPTQITTSPFTTSVRFACDAPDCIRGNQVSIPATVKADNQVRLNYAKETATATGAWSIIHGIVKCPDHKAAPAE